MSIPGAFFLMLLAIVRAAWMVKTGISLPGVLLFAQAALGGLFMVFRRRADITAPIWVEAVAWLSACLPLVFFVAASGTAFWMGLLPVPGLALNLWALASLGIAFGIAPAHRGLVTQGPYHWLRHPMYAGELLSLVGGLIGAFGIWNAVVFLVFTATIMWRITEEEKVLRKTGYAAYVGLVKWRLVPGIW
jgi:protein-S-isoprenylcysteine O-methyltransferase Ste14